MPLGIKIKIRIKSKIPRAFSTLGRNEVPRKSTMGVTVLRLLAKSSGTAGGKGPSDDPFGRRSLEFAFGFSFCFSPHPLIQHPSCRI